MKADSLPILLRSLELSAFAREAESVLARAEAENWGYRRLLQHLAEAEVQGSPRPQDRASAQILGPAAERDLRPL